MCSASTVVCVLLFSKLLLFAVLYLPSSCCRVASNDLLAFASCCTGLMPRVRIKREICYKLYLLINNWFLPVELRASATANLSGGTLTSLYCRRDTSTVCGNQMRMDDAVTRGSRTKYGVFWSSSSSLNFKTTPINSSRSLLSCSPALRITGLPK